MGNYAASLGPVGQNLRLCVTIDLGQPLRNRAFVTAAFGRSTEASHVSPGLIRRVTDVRDGSNSDLIAALIDVRSSPRNGHREFGAQGPKVPCWEIAHLSTVLARKADPRARLIDGE
jgi:hypothetical protein